MIENVSQVSSSPQINSAKRAEPEPQKEEKETEKFSANRDEYVPSEEKESIGLYCASSDSSDKDGTTTANTDNVDREIKALREKARILAQRLRGADESTAETLKRELEQVTAELSQKDNDEYRRQNAVFT